MHYRIFLILAASSAISAANLRMVNRRYVAINLPVGMAEVKDIYIDARLRSLTMVLSNPGKLTALDARETGLFEAMQGMNPALTEVSKVKNYASFQDSEGIFLVLVPPHLEQDYLDLKDKKVLANLTLIGCCNRGKQSYLYLLEGLNAAPKTVPTRKPSCKIDELQGIKPGLSLAAAQKIAKSKGFKQVKDQAGPLGRNVNIFIIDESKKLVLFLYDGGPDYRDYLHAVQMTIYSDAEASITEAVSFGMSEDKLVKHVGKKVMRSQGEGNNVKLLEFPEANCSFEVTDDKLTSVQIFGYE
jgi:azurin